MRRERFWVGLALAAALVVPLTGCAGKVTLDMAKMCEAHGGKWSPAEETCEMSATEARQAKRHARDICAYQGGTYLPGGTCILPGT